MRVLVYGGAWGWGKRGRNRDRVGEVLNTIAAERGVTLIISNGGRGAAGLANTWAALNGIPSMVITSPNWRVSGAPSSLHDAWLFQYGNPELVILFGNIEHARRKSSRTHNIRMLAENGNIEIIRVKA